MAPGFIDSHTHDDQAVLSQSDMTLDLPRRHHGGHWNCGISIAPTRAGTPLPAPLSLLEDTGETASKP
jgi:N-acyl-D-amino-acid deacylase